LKREGAGGEGRGPPGSTNPPIIGPPTGGFFPTPTSTTFTVVGLALATETFVKNMITGASQADAAVLVVSTIDGVQAQTREHVFLSRDVGVNQLIIGMNKDRCHYPTLPDEKKYLEVKEEISKLLKMVGVQSGRLPSFPWSGLMGKTTSPKPSENMKWWKGPTLLQALNNLKVPEKPTKLTRCACLFRTSTPSPA